jgi:hypothetical protein
MNEKSKTIDSRHFGKFDETVEDNNDPLYESLRRMSKSLVPLNNQVKRENKKALHSSKTKLLTLAINEACCTDGLGRIDVVTREYCPGQVLYTKKFVPCFEHLVQDQQLSDTVSVDIDADSTYLPRMCKLMIILQGNCGRNPKFSCFLY